MHYVCATTKINRRNQNGSFSNRERCNPVIERNITNAPSSVVSLNAQVYDVNDCSKHFY